MTSSVPFTPQPPIIGVLTVSDRAFCGEYEDRGGPAVLTYINAHFDHPLHTEHKVVPDEQQAIEEALYNLSDRCCLILTTGGTGVAPRDVTPEATAAVCQKLLPGFGEAMRAASISKVPTAILSRQMAGVCATSVIVNLPGSPKAIAECLDPVLPSLPHAVRLVGSAQVLRLKKEFHPTGRMCTDCGITH